MALRPRAPASNVGRAFELGIEIGGCVVIGMAIGYYLDRWLDTKPYLLLVFLVLGFAAALRALIRFTRRAAADQAQLSVAPDEERDP